MKRVQNTFLYGKWIAAVLLILGLCLNTGVVFAAGEILFQELFETDAGVGLLPGYQGFGWGLATVEESDLIPGYLSYPVDGMFEQESGAIEFVLQRDDRGMNPKSLQTVFCVLDIEGIPKLRFYISWQTTRPGDTTVNLNGLDALLPVPPNASIHLGRVVEKGEWVHFLLNWDLRVGVSRLYINGSLSGEWVQDVNEIYEGVAFHPDGNPNNSHRKVRMPSGFQHLVIGAVPTVDNPILGSSPLVGAVVDNIRVHGEALDPGNLLHVDSVTHNGFRSAGYSGKLVSGDRLTVTVKGDPYLNAYYDIGTTRDIPMEEDPGRPGTYIGIHNITHKDGVFEGPVIGRLVSDLGLNSPPTPSRRGVEIDSNVYLKVDVEDDLIPADMETISEITVAAADANGNTVRDRELKLTLTTTDEYTGIVGSGIFSDLVGGELDVDWGGVTDSFGAVTAQYISGFAAKTILISAKDMISGDVGVGYVRSFIEGSVDIVVTEPKVRALSVAGSMDISLSREWLTADGRSRSRITAVIRGAEGQPVSGHTVRFTLLGHNGSIRVIQGKTDSRGRAIADYIAGIVMGQVQVEVRDLTSGMVAVVPIELRPDAPAEIALSAEPGEVMAAGETIVTARVTDANGNPNSSVDVLYEIAVGTGELSSASVATDDEGIAAAVFTAGNSSGVVTVRGTVTSRVPTRDEISAAEGAVFLYGLDEDPGRLEVIEWLVKTGDEVMEGQKLVLMEDRVDTVYTVVAPRGGIMSVFTAEERDRVEYGDTLGYILPLAE